MLRRSVVVVATLAACTSTGGLTGGGDVPDGGTDSGATPSDAGKVEGAVATDADADAQRPASTPYRDAVLADSPLAYYRLEENGGALAADEVDGGVGAAAYTNVMYGKAGALPREPSNAVELTAGKIAVQDPRLAFSGLAVFTLEVWVYPKSIDGYYHRIISYEAPTTQRDGYLLFVQNTAVGVQRWLADGAQDATMAGTLLLGAWSYLVATFDGTVLTFYLNGQKAAGATGPAPSLANINVPFTMGTDSRAGIENFVGLLDEIAVYDKALSATQVAAHYSAAMEK